MANILDFLQAVLTDAEARSAFRSDPAGYVVWAGFGDLTGEDVVEAVHALMPSLPPATAGALLPFRDGDALPPIEPRSGESELGASVRLLSYAVGRCATIAGDDRPTMDVVVDAPEESVVDDPSALPPDDTPLAADTYEPPAPVVDDQAPEPFTIDEDDFAPVEDVEVAQRDKDTAAEPGPTLPEPVSARLATALDVVVRDAREHFGALLADAERATKEQVAAAESRLADVVQTTTDELNQLRHEAIADREAARRYREEATREADGLLVTARTQVDEARALAEELLANARAESDATQAELDARRAELRDVERQLRERLAGIDSLFRTALRDDPDPSE
ncbi:MAG: hypothetical protein ACRD0G_15460 [Acidimicrobiales bacterium]